MSKSAAPLMIVISFPAVVGDVVRSIVSVSWGSPFLATVGREEFTNRRHSNVWRTMSWRLVVSKHLLVLQQKRLMTASKKTNVQKTECSRRDPASATFVSVGMDSAGYRTAWSL